MVYEEVEDKLDLSDDFDEYVTLEEAYNDISGIVNQMMSVQGVSQKMVEPYKVALEDICPLNTYTKTPTMVNYQVTLEEFDKTSAGMIAGIIAIVSAIIVKIVSWLMRTARRNKELNEKAEKAIENVRAIDQAETKIMSAAKTENKRTIESDLEELVTRVIDESRNRWTALSESVISRNNGFYMDLVDLSVVMAGELDMLAKATKAFESLLVKINSFKPSGAPIDPKQNELISELIALHGPDYAKIISSKMSRDVKGLSGLERPIDMMREIKKTQVDMSTAAAVKVFDPEYWRKYVAENKLKPFALGKTDVLKSLNQLENAVKVLDNKSNVSVASPALQKATKDTLHRLQERFNTVQVFFDILDNCWQAEARILRTITNYSKRRFNLIRREILTNGDEKVKEILERESDAIKSELKKI